MAEGLWGRSREGQVTSLLEAYRIPYTGSDPLAASLTLDKGYAKRLWLQNGVPTAKFAVIEMIADCEDALRAIGEFPLFTKPLREGASKGVDSRSVVCSLEQLVEQAQRLLECYRQPILVEEYLPGREFTVGVLGGEKTARAIGAVEVNTAEVNSFAVKEEWEDLNENYYTAVESPDLADQLGELALRAYRALGCRDIGRVDMRLDKQGQPQVMEINAIPALHPTHSAMSIIGSHFGLPYDALLAEIIDHARQRWAV
jgi:D-alanine-D-alanine ligase